MYTCGLTVVIKRICYVIAYNFAKHLPIKKLPRTLMGGHTLRVAQSPLYPAAVLASDTPRE